MSVSDDVGNLFRRFGGDAGQYQEVTRDDDAKHAALRWPLLNALDIAHTEPVPDAGRPAASPAARVQPAAQASQPSQPARAVDAPGASESESTGPARPPLFARGHRHASMPPPVVAPAQMGASRFSPPPTVAAAADRTNAAANAPTMSAAQSAPSIPSVPVTPVAESPTKSVAPAPVVAPPAPPATLASLPSRDAAPQRPAQAVPAAPFFAERQTFARAPFNKPVTESPRVESQQGGSILAGLFGGKNAPQPEARSQGPSKDLSTLFARLSHGSAAPSRSLRDTFKSRFKADGDA